MAILFDGKAGVAVPLPDSSQPGAPITVEGLENSFEPFRAVVTGVGLRANENVLFSHTLGDFIYIYVFGERIGELAIHGVAFIDGCQDNGVTGLAGLLNYYRANRVSQRATPLTVQLGSQAEGVLEGFLVGMTTDLLDPELKIAQFSMHLAMLPSETGREESL